jgi:hypothetical protein
MYHLLQQGALIAEGDESTLKFSPYSTIRILTSRARLALHFEHFSSSAALLE